MLLHRRRRVSAAFEHRHPEQAGDADAGRAGAIEDDALLGERGARCRRPARRPPTTTAAVPWMSSLKEGTTSR